MIDRSLSGGIVMDTSAKLAPTIIPMKNGRPYQPTLVFPDALKLTRQEKLFLSSASNPASPFHKIIGNSDAVAECTSVVFNGLGRLDHCVSDGHIAYIGPPGVGKTLFAKSLAKSLGLPFIEVSPDNIKTPDNLFYAMQTVFRQYKIKDADGVKIGPMQMVNLGDRKYAAPACTIFIDEVHRLKGLAQSLLTATEPTSHTMSGEFGTLNTKDIQWQIATTDVGLLFDAFYSRFLTIELMPYNREEMARIVHGANPDIPLEACRHLTKYYYLISREALTAAGRIRTARDMNGGSWEKAVEEICKRDGIDDFGLSRKRVAVLRALYDGKKSLATLAGSIGVKVEELETFVLPPMQLIGNGFVPLIETTSGGRRLTQAGREAWEMRLAKEVA